MTHTPTRSRLTRCALALTVAGAYTAVSPAGPVVGAPTEGAGDDTATAAEEVVEAVRAEVGEERSEEVSAAPAEPLVEPVATETAASGTADDWVFGSATVPLASSSEQEVPTASLFLAHGQDGQWEVELQGTPGFSELARIAPASVLSAGEKRTFAANQSAQLQRAVTTPSQPSSPQASDPAPARGLSLPWQQGDSWFMGGGPHSDNFSSLDFNGGTGQVQSAGSGRMYTSCERGGSALVTVVHTNGYSTSYYHMRELTDRPDGSLVDEDTYLGMIGNELPCGGFSTGAHVHFSLLEGDSPVGVDGKRFGGWTFHQGRAAYEGYAEREGRRVRAGSGVLRNYGGDERDTAR